MKRIFPFFMSCPKKCTDSVIEKQCGGNYFLNFRLHIISTLHNSSLMRKQSGFKKLVKWKWYEIRNFINKFGWNSIFKKIFSITSGLNGLLILIGDKVRYKKGSKKLKPKGMVLVKGRNQGFSNPYFLKIWSTKT